MNLHNYISDFEECADSQLSVIHSTLVWAKNLITTRDIDGADVQIFIDKAIEGLAYAVSEYRAQLRQKARSRHDETYEKEGQDDFGNLPF